MSKKEELQNKFEEIIGDAKCISPMDNHIACIDPKQEKLYQGVSMQMRSTSGPQHQNYSLRRPCSTSKIDNLTVLS